MPAEEFRFAISQCFEISGRGVVVVGVIESGSVRIDDALELVHAGQKVWTRCSGILRGHGREPNGGHFDFLGLVLPGVRKFTVEVGDHVTGRCRPS